jgi:hypothetical protein
MRVRIVGFVAAATFALSLVALPVFHMGGTADASAGCQAFGLVTANGAKGIGWGMESKSQNETFGPGIIASNNEGAKATLCD